MIIPCRAIMCLLRLLMGNWHLQTTSMYRVSRYRHAMRARLSEIICSSIVLLHPLPVLDYSFIPLFWQIQYVSQR